ncbi:LacI family DNA-binding transcriptional regulator [Mycoplasmatota bacterium]|nr:LacI family DNA-binding transcriptional regulator [Mycoplasmatota bacterium]
MTTIKDVAKEVGVSVTTVSLVLNHKSVRVSEATRKKIFEVAEKLKYTPNFAARSLVSKESKTIGLIIPDIENAFFSSLYKSIEDYARSLGYMVLLMNNNDSHQTNLEVIDLLLNRHIDGLLLVISNESYQEQYQEEMKRVLLNLSIPLVMVDRVFDDSYVNKVHFDNQLGGYLATRHLIDHGHKKIACITGPKDTKSSEKRLKGYYQAMKEANLTINEDLLLEGDYHFDSGRIRMNELLNKDLTGIFAFNDLMAYGAIFSIYDVNKDIPDDYSIIGYDHFLLATLLNSQLDSIEQNSKILGEEACKILFSEIKNKTEDRQNICLEPVLFKSGSVKEI